MPTDPPLPFFARLRDDVAYVLPMVAFLALTQVGVTWPSLFPVSYIIKTIVAALLLVALWRHFTPIRWTHLTLGLLIGVVGIVQWIGTEKLLLHFFPDYPRLGRGADPFNPFTTFSTPARAWSFIAIRWAGAALVVPVMEELFWRDFLWRTLLAPNDFKLASVGEWDPKTFLIISLLFASVHPQWITATVYGLLIGGLLVYTRSLGACILCHATTNFLLGLYVLHTREWFFW